MATKKKDLTDEEILRFLRFSITEKTTATYTEQAVDTQLSIDRGVILLIHFAEFHLPLENIDDPAEDTTELLEVQVTRESKLSLVELSDSDCIIRVSRVKDRVATIGTEAGPIIFTQDNPMRFGYDPAIPYAASNIFIGVKSSANAPKTYHGRIGYTLRNVNEKFFYRVAHALIS